MTEYLTDIREAIAQRDAHAYSAIEYMAKQAGMSKEAWSKAHPTLTDDEKRTYDECVMRFENWARREWYPNAP
jgi:hypothetical protein